jgi:MarR family transcriptional regulator, organic hydroperoxide resistance regulator
MVLPYHAAMQDDLVRRFRRAYRQALYDLDVARLRQWEQSRVTLPQLRVLYQVRRAPGITTRDLARALGITVSTTSGLVIKLVDRGLVARTTAPDDRRQAPLLLTPEGAALIGEFAEDERSFIGRVAARLADDLAPVTAALEQLDAAAGAVRAAEPAADGRAVADVGART